MQNLSYELYGVHDWASIYITLYAADLDQLSRQQRVERSRLFEDMQALSAHILLKKNAGDEVNGRLGI